VSGRDAAGAGDDVAYRAPDLSQPALVAAPDCAFLEAPADGVLPSGFFATTNHPTYVKHAGRWSLPRRPRMDGHLVLLGDGAVEVREARAVRAGDRVAVAERDDGSEGVLTWAEGFAPAARGEGFAFMGSRTSREKPADYDALAELFLAHRRRRILWVIGPALVHARGRASMEWLVQRGFCHALASGNAVAVHDVEAALFGTTLGMNADGTSAPNGHVHHLRAINEVRGAGSIAALVRSGRLRTGVMHALTEAGVPYVLAGSIRDDGPLPEVVTDALAAQAAMRALAEEATLVVMVATALHSIAMGNLLPTYRVSDDGLPARIEVVCVDQTEFAVEKLRDRGTHQALGFVTNAQDFVRLLHLELARRLGE
jgi:lysine-ketoglutarate reductase/saccharopine dehydrogenase-like protein (TIGR00300 family)